MLELRSFPNREGGITAWPEFQPIGFEYFIPDVPSPEVAPVAVPTTPPAHKALPARQSGRGDMDQRKRVSA